MRYTKYSYNLMTNLLYLVVILLIATAPYLAKTVAKTVGKILMDWRIFVMKKQIRKKKGIVRQNRIFRLSEYELQKLSEGATTAGMNESQYVRELILHGGVDATHAENRRNLIRQVSGIATNINQIAKRCNETKWITNMNVYDMRQALEEVVKLLKQLMERWR